MGKEYVLAAFSRQEGKIRQRLEQHFNNISVLGVVAQSKFYGKKLPEGWGRVERHISSCEQCQYDVANLTEALQGEQEAMMDYLFPQ